jgi:hypothetical protein
VIVRVVHVVPVWDLLVHEVDVDGDCPCGPRWQHDPGHVPMYAHSSLDGRERHEHSRWWRWWRKATRRPLGWKLVEYGEEQ